MRLRRSVYSQPAVASFFITEKTRCSFPCGEQGAESGARRGVLYHAAALAVRQEPVGEPQHPDEPVEDVCLELGAGGAGGPDHALDAEPGRKCIPRSKLCDGIQDCETNGDEAALLCACGWICVLVTRRRSPLLRDPSYGTVVRASVS